MKYKQIKITVDGVIIDNNNIILIRRKNPPYKNKWALPGGFVEYGEKTEKAVLREIFEETSLKTEILNMIGVYSDPSRDPRGHTISVVYLLKNLSGILKGGDDALEAKYFDVDDLPDLAFDHDKIINDAIKRCK